MEDRSRRTSRPLTEASSFEHERTGGSVEPATPRDLARQAEDAEAFTPVGPRWLVRRSATGAIVGGAVVAVVLALIGLAPWGFLSTWARVGVFAVIGAAAGSVYGALVGVGVPRRRESGQPTLGSPSEVDDGA